MPCRVFFYNGRVPMVSPIAAGGINISLPCSPVNMCMYSTSYLWNQFKHVCGQWMNSIGSIQIETLHHVVRIWFERIMWFPYRVRFELDLFSPWRIMAPKSKITAAVFQERYGDLVAREFSHCITARTLQVALGNRQFFFFLYNL